VFRNCSGFFEFQLESPEAKSCAPRHPPSLPPSLRLPPRPSLLSCVLYANFAPSLSFPPDPHHLPSPFSFLMPLERAHPPLSLLLPLLSMLLSSIPHASAGWCMTNCSQPVNSFCPLQVGASAQHPVPNTSNSLSAALPGRRVRLSLWGQRRAARARSHVLSSKRIGLRGCVQEVSVQPLPPAGAA
jgi:hypothetical protein